MKMTKKISLLLAIVIVGGMVMSSCNKKVDESAQSSPEESGTIISGGNLATGMPYAYSYTPGSQIRIDTELTMLTDGDKEKAEKIAVRQITENRGDWGGTTRNLKGFIDENDAYYHITLDLGFIASTKKITLTFPETEDCVLPKAIELFGSTDGYNFTTFISDDVSISETEAVFNFADPILAKALRFYIYSPVGTSNAISEIEVDGYRAVEPVLLSKGASYTWDGEVRGGLNDDDKKLTDGIFSTGSEKTAIVAKKSTTKDDITKKNAEIIKLDLGEVKNISSVITDAIIRIGFSMGVPEKLVVRYSTDDEQYDDFGQAYISTMSGNTANSRSRFLVTRNHTVKARYVMLVFHTEGNMMLDEISVYGSNTVVAEPVSEYGFFDYGLVRANTNVAAYRKVTVAGAQTTALTDMMFSKSSDVVNGTKETAIVIDATDIKDVVVGASVSMLKNEVIEFVFESESDDGTRTKAQEFEIKVHTVGDLTTATAHFVASKEKKYIITVKTKNDAKLTEVQLFGNQAQLPLVRGGFFQLPTNGGLNPSAQNSDYAWHLQLKGMKELGMDYVVIQYSAHFLAKSTLINGENIKALGYKYTDTYGSVDLPLAVLDAAQKLGMKVWLGTIHDADFNNINAGKANYDAIVEAGKAVIKDIDKMYGDHPAFAGYYLSDETCDQWLNSSGGVDAARKIYKGQSDLIHEIAPEKSVMIAPAIWRSGTPQKGADNLYKMLAPEQEGGRPVVDIVAAQDCLGRENSIIVAEQVYGIFETYIEKWAEAVRKAGAEFWNDTEVFDVTSSPKRGFEVINSVQQQAKYTNATIVFDIPHYFTSYPMHSYNTWSYFMLNDQIKEYSKFYAGYKVHESRSSDAKAPQSVLLPIATNNGGNGGDKNPTDHLVKHDNLANKAVKVNAKPSFDSFTGLSKFAKSDTGFTPEYKVVWDDNNLYILLQTNDATASFGKGEWWSGKDDLVQIWLTADGSIQSTDALHSDYGIRAYLHRTKATEWTAGIEASEKITNSGTPQLETKEIGGKTAMIITISWDSLERTAPTTGDKTAVGLKLQYIDGANEKWSSTDGTYDRSVGSLFGF